jgi:TonB family protein
MRLILSLAAILIPPICLAQSPSNFFNQGRQEFNSARYAEAADNFRKAVESDPANVQAHLHLGVALEMQYIPGTQDAANLQFAADATAQFQKVLELQPNHILALYYLATLSYNEQKIDEAAEWYKKIIAVNPDQKDAYYTHGVIAFNKWLPVDRQARLDSHQHPDDPGPIGDVQIRANLRATWLPILDEGVHNTEHAVQIDPKYWDAMAYLNLLIRYRADLDDTTEQYDADIEQANLWMQKSLDTRRAQADDTLRSVSANPPPTTPLAAGANVIAANLVTKADAVYPPLALQARISGTVRFSVTIGPDGRVESANLISGHPLLVQSAREAVQQYLYKPTLLNGQPVTVKTTVDVVFELSPN